MLYLSEQDQIQNHLLSVEGCIKSIEEMFALMYAGDYVMGGRNQNSHGSRMSVTKENGENLYIVMPAHLGGRFNTTGVKFHGPNRYIKGSEKESNFILMLSDGDTGEPKAIMPCNLLTTYRTAAVSAYATQHLLAYTPEQIGIIGPGKINTEYVRWLLDYYPSIKRVKVKGRSEQGISNFISLIEKKVTDRVEISVCETIEEAVRNSDIVSVVTGFQFASVADMPFLRDKWIKEGSLIVCPSFIKFTDSFIQKKANLVVDNYKMYESYAEELGRPVYFKLSNLGNLLIDLVDSEKIKREDIHDLSNLTFGTEKIDAGKAIIFSSGGMGIEDIAVGCDVLNMAVNKKIGTYLEFLGGK